MEIRALVFDVFGTVVDWRGGVAREVRRLLGPSVDGEAFADDWRGRYVPSMERVRSGELPWTPLDALHRASLSSVLANAGLAEVPSDVRALVFDVFGTVVDWRGGVAREVRRLLGPAVDAAALADDWRERYVPSMEQVRSGELPWTPLDALHRASLDDVLVDAGLTDVPPEVREELVLAWHRLDPWPDVVPGLRRLARSHVLAPLSNGNIALQVDLARRSGLPWDCVLGAEVVRRYKPDPEVYDSAPRLLAVPPSSVLMVAAHLDDLAAARARGLRTAYVHRPEEFGGRVVPPSTDPDADLSVASFAELADRLGA